MAHATKSQERNVHITSGIIPGHDMIEFRQRIRTTGTKRELVRLKSGGKLITRRVFLVAIPSQDRWKSIFTDTPMMSGGRQVGPWPRLIDNVHIFRYWLVCLIEDSGHKPPTKSQLLDADFFYFPQQPLIRKIDGGRWKLPPNVIGTVEAIQDLGVTQCYNESIDRFSNDLNGLWGRSYPLLWNSQQFSIRLAYLTLRGRSRRIATPVLRAFLARLRKARQHFQATRYFSCAAATVGFGVLSFGIGAIATWLIEGRAMASEKAAEESVSFRMADLERRFRRLKDLQF